MKINAETSSGGKLIIAFHLFPLLVILTKKKDGRAIPSRNCSEYQSQSLINGYLRYILRSSVLSKNARIAKFPLVPMCHSSKYFSVANSVTDHR